MGVTCIGDNAFEECTSLTDIVIPNSVTSIGGGAFSGCSGLTSVTIPERLTCIEWGTFRNCSSLTSVIIPGSVTSIGDDAFRKCKSLKSITIPNGVTNIGSSAFYDCSILETIIIPNSVTSIGGYAFHNTAWFNNQPDGIVYAGLVAYNYKGTMPFRTKIVIKAGTKGVANFAFYRQLSLNSVTIPSSVINIGDGAFAECDNLTTVTLLGNVRYIGNSAFYECRLKDFYCLAVKIPETIYIFSSSTTDLSQATLHVYASVLADYRKTEPWNGFGNIVALTEEELATPIQEVKENEKGEKNEVGAMYDLNGRHIATPRRGVALVRSSDGRMHKILTK